MTPFDTIISGIKTRRYHNPRVGEHINTLRRGIVGDPARDCPDFGSDLSTQVVACWEDVRDLALFNRKLDFVSGEPDSDGAPDVNKLRVCIKHKSAITSHRAANSRFADLAATSHALEWAKSEAILVAVVIVGVAEKVLNVPDGIKPRFKKQPDVFKKEVLPRLSTGDQSLWDEFAWAVSENRPDAPQSTIKKFRELQLRRPGRTHIIGYDYLLLAPAYIDNVNPPYIVPPGDPRSFGIDVESDYAKMLEIICKAYTARWHL